MIECQSCGCVGCICPPVCMTDAALRREAEAAWDALRTAAWEAAAAKFHPEQPEPHTPPGIGDLLCDPCNNFVAGYIAAEAGHAVALAQKQAEPAGDVRQQAEAEFEYDANDPVQREITGIVCRAGNIHKAFRDIYAAGAAAKQAECDRLKEQMREASLEWLDKIEQRCEVARAEGAAERQEAIGAALVAKAVVPVPGNLEQHIQFKALYDAGQALLASPDFPWPAPPEAESSTNPQGGGETP